MDPAELTPTQLMARVECKVEYVDRAHAALLTSKTYECAAEFQRAKRELGEVRALLPKPRLVTT